MNPSEFREKEFHWGRGTSSPSGRDWLERFIRQYPYLVWFNPMHGVTSNSYFDQTHREISEMLDMYRLSREGLEQGMKRLMSRR